ncbi:MAG: prohibitin family protein, partial [Bacteroidia bacterium]
MVLIIVGLILLLIPVIFARSADPRINKFRPLMRIGGFVILLVGLLASSIRQIEPGEVGVQTLFGQVQNRTLESGLNLVNPM